MRKILLFFIIVIGVLGSGFVYRYFIPEPILKVYVAVEGEGKVVAFDPEANKIVSTIDLSVVHDGGWLEYAPHNIQVSPDMKTVWVTANVNKHEDHAFIPIPSVFAHGDKKEEDELGESDEIIIIDPKTDGIIKRIPVGLGLHLAHVVLTPDNSVALVTAQNENTIYKINAQTYEIKKKINLDLQEPHGIRLSPDGKTAYIAILKGKALGILDLESDIITTVFLGGEAVQTGITPDGKYSVASLYDTKRLAVYDITTKKVKNIELPENSKGPVQMYATPDSRFIYLADQGYYFGEPTNEFVYKIDMQIMGVVKEIKVGQGPHGVIVNEDGTRVYVTNLISGDVSVIDTTTDQEINRIKVGKEPNGISIWHEYKTY